MNNPLDYDDKVCKEFGIDESIMTAPELLLAHVRIQFEEIQKFLNRERVELVLSEAQAQSDIEAIAADAKTKVAAHRNTIKGIVASLRVLLTLKDELEARIKG